MSETQPRATTQYPTGEPLVITAPLNTPMSIAQLIAADSTIANLNVQIAGLQTQITALAARVTALEQAASEGTSSASTPA